MCIVHLYFRPRNAPYQWLWTKKQSDLNKRWNEWSILYYLPVRTASANSNKLGWMKMRKQILPQIYPMGLRLVSAICWILTAFAWANMINHCLKSVGNTCCDFHHSRTFSWSQCIDFCGHSNRSLKTASMGFTSGQMRKVCISNTRDSPPPLVRVSKSITRNNDDDQVCSLGGVYEHNVQCAVGFDFTAPLLPTYTHVRTVQCTAHNSTQIDHDTGQSLVLCYDRSLTLSSWSAWERKKKKHNKNNIYIQCIQRGED